MNEYWSAEELQELRKNDPEKYQEIVEPEINAMFPDEENREEDLQNYWESLT